MTIFVGVSLVIPNSGTLISKIHSIDWCDMQVCAIGLIKLADKTKTQIDCFNQKTKA